MSNINRWKHKAGDWMSSLKNKIRKPNGNIPIHKGGSLMKNLPSTKNQWDPFYEMESLHNQINRLFDFSFPEYNGGENLLKGRWAPAVDVVDSKDRITVKADLPGLKKEDIDISLHDNVLTIKGEKKQESKVNEDDFVRTERFYGTFQRSINLGAEVDTAKANADFKDGVLQLTLPKREEAKPKQIKIDLK